MVSVGFLLFPATNSSSSPPSIMCRPGFICRLWHAWSAAALIRPRPWLGMHIPWSASTPLGKHELQSSLLRSVLTLIRLWPWTGRRFPELRGHFQWRIVVLRSRPPSFSNVCCRSPIYSPPPLTSCPSALRNVCRLVDYTTPEVPLSLFGLGHDWACTFRGAPLPRCGQARAPEFTFVKRLNPNSASAMKGQAIPWTSCVFVVESLICNTRLEEYFFIAYSPSNKIYSRILISMRVCPLKLFLSRSRASLSWRDFLANFQRIWNSRMAQCFFQSNSLLKLFRNSKFLRPRGFDQEQTCAYPM